MKNEDRIEIRPLDQSTGKDFILWLRRERPYGKWDLFFGVHRYLTDEEVYALQEDPNVRSDERIDRLSDAAQALISEGKFRGYLAYVSGQIAGYCACNAKSAFTFLGRGVPEFIYRENPEGTLVLADLATGESFRRRGVATALVLHALQEAQASGFSVAECCPSREFLPLYVEVCRRILSRAGFEPVYRSEVCSVYRKRLL